MIKQAWKLAEGNAKAQSAWFDHHIDINDDPGTESDNHTDMSDDSEHDF